MMGLFKGVKDHYTQQGGLEGLLSNPVFQVGLGLLESNNAPSGPLANPYTGALSGLQRASQFKDRAQAQDYAQQQRARAEEEWAYQQQERARAEEARAYELNRKQQLDSLLVPGATPGINPQEAFLQYGTPQQQSTALTQINSNERFKQQAEAEEARWQRGQNTPRHGTYNPRDYTTDAWADFVHSGDPGQLERYEPTRQVDVGGVKYNIDRVTGAVTPIQGGRDETIRNVRDIKQAAAQGSAQGSGISTAQAGKLDLESLINEIEDTIFNNPHFGGAVGPLDAITGRIGEGMGTEEGVLGGQVERLTNRLVLDIADKWKGAISEKELQFFKDSVPGRSSSPQTWKRWFRDELLPRHKKVARLSQGEPYQPQKPSGKMRGTTSSGVEWELVE